MSHKIIIHGASGFLGKHFLKALNNQGHRDVTVIAREGSKVSSEGNHKIYTYKNNIKELMEDFSGKGGGVFFEFSWHGVFGGKRNEAEQLTVNVPLITFSVEFANHIKAKHWVGFGSQAEYGNRNRKINEEDTTAPTTLYGKAKVITGEISRELCNIYGMEYSWIRIFSLYGPGENHEWFIPYIIKNMVENKTVETTKGEQKWDYLYVEDAAKALLKIPENRGTGVANLGSGKTVEIREIISKIKELAGSTSKVNQGAVPYRPDQVMYMEADIDKIKKHLDWLPETDILQGLKKTIDFYKQNKEITV